jgi:hypothetical protein
MVGRNFKNSTTHAPFQGFAERSNASGCTAHEVHDPFTRFAELKTLTHRPTRPFQS